MRNSEDKNKASCFASTSWVNIGFGFYRPEKPSATAICAAFSARNKSFSNSRRRRRRRFVWRFLRFPRIRFEICTLDVNYRYYWKFHKNRFRRFHSSADGTDLRPPFSPRTSRNRSSRRQHRWTPHAVGTYVVSSKFKFLRFDFYSTVTHIVFGSPERGGGAAVLFADHPRFMTRDRRRRRREERPAPPSLTLSLLRSVSFARCGGDGIAPDSAAGQVTTRTPRRTRRR